MIGCFIKQKMRAIFSLSFFYFWIIADAENVIHGHVVKDGKLDQNVGWNVSLPELVIAVYLLRAIQGLGHFPLR